MRPCIRRGSRSFFAGHGLCEQEQTSCPTCIVVYMFGSRQPHSVGGCALIVNLDCGVEAFLDSCKIFRKLRKGAHCSARLTEGMNQRHARGFENRHSHSVDGSLLAVMSSPQLPPPVEPNYRIEALTGYAKAAPLPLNSRPDVSNTDVKSLTLGIVNRRRIRHHSSYSPAQVLAAHAGRRGGRSVSALLHEPASPPAAGPAAPTICDATSTSGGRLWHMHPCSST